MRPGLRLVFLIQWISFFCTAVPNGHAAESGLYRAGIRLPSPLLTAMESAVAEHPRISAARSDVDAAGKLVEAGGYRLAPVFSTSTKTGREGDRIATFSLKQAIWDGGAREAEYDGNLAKERASKSTFSETADDVRKRVVVAYIAVAKAREMIELSENNLKEHQSAHDSIVARERGGLGTISDVMMVDARIQQAKSAVTGIDPNDGITKDGTVDITILNLLPGSTWSYSTNGGRGWPTTPAQAKPSALPMTRS